MDPQEYLEFAKEIESLNFLSFLAISVLGALLVLYFRWKDGG